MTKSCNSGVSTKNLSRSWMYFEQLLWLKDVYSIQISNFRYQNLKFEIREICSKICCIRRALASAPVYTIAAALGINTDAAQQLQNADYSKIAIGPDECLAACNQTDAGALSAPENPAFNEQMTSG